VLISILISIFVVQSLQDKTELQCFLSPLLFRSFGLSIPHFLILGYFDDFYIEKVNIMSQSSTKSAMEGKKNRLFTKECKNLSIFQSNMKILTNNSHHLFLTGFFSFSTTNDVWIWVMLFLFIVFFYFFTNTDFIS
jgi:hypothetical protein